jgi:2-dehydropantoate 2-reductase
MRTIHSVLVVGAGAVGSAVASLIHESLPDSIAVLSGGARRERNGRDGFVVNGKRHDFRLVEPGNAKPFDLVIVAVKNHHLSQAIGDMAGAVGPETLILSLMNGIESEAVLGSAFGREKLPLAYIIGIDAVREGNATDFSASGRIVFGDETNRAGSWSERVGRIAEFFTRTGIAFEVPEDMVRSYWFKFMVNVGINQASAVLGAPYGVFLAVPEANSLMESAMREVVALAGASGIGLGEADIAAWKKTLAALGPEGKTSMLQDVEAGRKTEVEAFAGTIVSLGEKYGIPTPVNRVLFDIIRTIEKTY